MPLEAKFDTIYKAGDNLPKATTFLDLHGSVRRVGSIFNFFLINTCITHISPLQWDVK